MAAIESDSHWSTLAVTISEKIKKRLFEIQGRDIGLVD